MKRFVMRAAAAAVMSALCLTLTTVSDAKYQAAKPPKAEEVASPSDAVLPMPALVAPIPAGEAPIIVSSCEKCDDRCIKYKHHITLRKTGSKCVEPIKTILVVKDPCNCCEVEIPVCLPGCCTGEPKLCSHPGILGRNIVEYEWCCGFRVKIVFDRCGDITVHTYGR